MQPMSASPCKDADWNSFHNTVCQRHSFLSPALYQNCVVCPKWAWAQLAIWEDPSDLLLF